MEAVIGVGRPVGGIVFREDGFGFSVVVLVVSNMGRVTVRGIVSKVAVGGKYRIRADDHQGCQGKISRDVRHSSQS